MFKLIVFSKDRPPQLQVVGESLEKNTPFFQTTVIYKATTPSFEEGYHQCFSEGFFESVIRETDFRQNILDELNSPYISFATDDGIFFRNIERESDNIKWALSHDNVSCVSLRLGANTPMNNYYTDMWGYVRFHEWNNYLLWDHNKSDGNFGYPLSVDAHIFRGDLIKELIENTNFHNPNSLEGNLQKFSNGIPPLMCAFKQSSYIGNSINRVQNYAANFAGGVHGVSAEELNKEYLKGRRIDWEKFPYHEIKSPHHEFKALWK